MPLTGRKGMNMEHKSIVMTLKLSWQEVSSLQTGIIGTILKRPVSCEASQDDMTYWDTAAIDGWFTLQEIHLLLDILWNIVYIEFYLKYDTNQDFDEQFIRNSAKVDEMMQRLLKEAEDTRRV